MALDYYQRQKADEDNHADPSRFIDALLENLPIQNVETTQFHKVLLCVSVQLLGKDFDDVISKSLKLLRIRNDNLTSEIVQIVSTHYMVYGQQERFVERFTEAAICAVNNSNSPLTLNPETLSTTVSRAEITTELPVNLFYSYSHDDEKLRSKLEKHLSTLRDEQIIADWHDRKILPGQEFDSDIDLNLKKANVILFLVSSNFLSSDYCKSIEVSLALKQSNKGLAVVVPVILKHCDWQNSPFGKLQALPKDGHPINGKYWKNLDEGLADVVKGIRRLIDTMRTKGE
ncbi:MAG: toll/interleukin-1 receptor domain-containing protein [Candidatus Hydrogenedentes bacterium]|nr:toll/interleukin-1 receptor domain-containing protein [Candidatus Hydrogenedentota bacterium]